MTLMRRAVLFAILSVGFSATCFAQATAGTPPFGAFGGGPADIVNLGNLNVHVDIPVVRKAGRGVPFNYDITYDTSLWSLPTIYESSVWQPAGPPNWSLGWLFPVQGGLQEIIASESFCGSPYPNGARVGFSITYFDPLGTPHPLPGGIIVSSGSCGNSETFYGGGVAADGSGYVLSGDSAANLKVTAKDGKVVFWTNSSGNYIQPVATDDNGNETTVDTSSSTFTDTLGIAAMALGGSGTPSSPKTFTYTAPSGANAAYTMKYTAYTVKTNFGCSGISEYGPTSQNLPTELDLPDGSKYTFTYEQTTGYSGDYTGRLASVTLPTGGTITYTYTGSHNGIVCTDGSIAGLTRQTPDGTWTYSRTINGGAASTTTITDPQNNQTIMNFVGIYPTEAQVYQGTAPTNLLQTTLTCYNGAVPSGSPATCNSTSITLPIMENTAYVQSPNGSNLLESKVDTFYDKETVGSTTTSNGLVTEVDEYDYGTNAPGSLLRKTTTTYASLTNNIVNRPYQVTIKDSSGNTTAQTTYGYDQGTPTATSGTPQHVSISGSRGNPTTISYLVSGSATFSKTFTYYDTGNVNTATDALTVPRQATRSAPVETPFPHPSASR